MIKFQNGSVIISLKTTDAGKSVQHEYTCEDLYDDDGILDESISKDAQIEMTKYMLYATGRCYGLHGHTLSKGSPAIDLNHALLHGEITKNWGVKVIEGQEILDAWKPKKNTDGRKY